MKLTEKFKKISEDEDVYKMSNKIYGKFEGLRKMFDKLGKRAADVADQKSLKKIEGWLDQIDEELSFIIQDNDPDN